MQRRRVPGARAQTYSARRSAHRGADCRCPGQEICRSYPLLSAGPGAAASGHRSEEHTSELQSLMRISYAVFCLKKKNHITHKNNSNILQTTHTTHIHEKTK